MKKSMKITKLPIAGEANGRAMATRCDNLRRNKVSQILDVVGLPAPVEGLGGLPFLVVSHSSAGRIALRAQGRVLFSKCIDMNPSPEEAVGELPGEYLCASQIDSCRIAIMTDGGSVYARISPEGRVALERSGRDYPALRFEAYGETQFTATVASGSLSGAYTGRNGALESADTARLSADMLTAYLGLHSAASASGYYMQPVLARYRLLGKDGETLYVSAPTAVCASEGFQCMNEVSLSLENGERRRGSGTLNARAFKLRLLSCADFDVDAFADVEKIVVETSHPIHPVDFDGSAPTAISRDGSSSATIRCYMPGVSVTMVPAPSIAMDRLKLVAGRSAEAFFSVAELYRPFGATEGFAFTVTPPKGVSAKEQTARINAIASATPAAETPLKVNCSLPHGFIARHVANTGSTLVWGDISPLRFKGYGAEQLAVKCIEGAVEWRARVSVKMADGGERVSCTTEGTHGAPLLLSPLLVYPSPDAVEMTILLFRGRDIYGAKFELTPAADGTFAYYASADGRPIELPLAGAGLQVEDDLNQIRRVPEGLLTAAIAKPFEPVGAVTTLPGKVTALAAVPRRGSAWEYTMRRCYLFSTAGIFLATLSADGSDMSVYNFDSRPVAGPQAVCATSHDRFPVVAIAGTDVVGLSRGSLTTLLSGSDATMIGWDAVDGELWLQGEGAPKVYCGLGPGYYRAAGLRAEGMHSAAEGIFIATAAGVLDTALGRTSEPVATAYSVHIESPDMDCRLSQPRLSGISFGMDARWVEGALDVMGDGSQLLYLGLQGKATPAVSARLLSYPAFALKIGLEGIANPGSTLHWLRLLF